MTTSDLIVLDRDVFTSFADIGPMWSGNFRIGTAAAGVYDRIIYNSATGELFYDADGTGAAAQVKFAEIGKGLALTSWNFAIML